MSGAVPSCPACGSADGVLGTSHAYFICRQCKECRYWTPDYAHPIRHGMTWAQAVKLSPWAHTHPNYESNIREQ